MAKELVYLVDARWERVPHPIVSLPGKASRAIIPRQGDNKEVKPSSLLAPTLLAEPRRSSSVRIDSRFRVWSSDCPGAPLCA